MANALAHAREPDLALGRYRPLRPLGSGGPGSVWLARDEKTGLDDAETLTAQGDVPGTLAYISPERLAGGPSTPAADVWSLGVMLWEALVRRHPFVRASLRETGDAIEAGAPPLADVRPDLPRAVTDIVDRALALDPRRRPSAAQFADALRSGRARRRR